MMTSTLRGLIWAAGFAIGGVIELAHGNSKIATGLFAVAVVFAGTTVVLRRRPNRHRQDR
jgi:hypothetical protein